jgi:tRNA wybutosine-synthesizing protein 3
MALPAIPKAFLRKKGKILAELSVPKDEYHDKSPKGSVDERIRPLIDELNSYEGLATTSSCAGRVSIFLEGDGLRPIAEGSDIVSSVATENGPSQSGDRKAPGSKGGGAFLFVSHNPLSLESTNLLQLFKLVPAADVWSKGSGAGRTTSETRFVRFSFEPMILHVMAASLKHAQPVLAAAINAGFRESGVQSLRNLDDPDACPMIAIRTVGLGLESIIGCSHALSEKASTTYDKKDGFDADAVHEAIVSEEYLNILVRLANERFVVNAERIQRFRSCLGEAMATHTKKRARCSNWMSVESRREHKRQAGLQLQMAKHADLSISRTTNDMDNDVLEDETLGNLQQLYKQLSVSS